MIHLSLPYDNKDPLRVYYLVSVAQGSVGHQILQNSLNCARIPYRSVVSDNHVNALNELMEEEIFIPKGSISELNGEILAPKIINCPQKPNNLDDLSY